jgi:hypothetical protein
MRSLALAAFVLGATLPSFAKDKLPGFDSPEKAFHAYLTGVVSEDFDLMLSSLTPEAKAYHVALSLFSAGFLFGQDPEMQKVFREHGIEPSSDDGDDGQTEEADEDSPDRALVDAVSKIKNPGKLMKQIADRHEKLAKLMASSGDARPESKRPTAKELLSSVTLGKITMKRNSAAATVTVAASAKDVFSAMPEKVQFRKIKSRWYCHIDPR